ncbi:MAG: hypothetical protein NTW62_01270 [Candidatus Nomurabacteria bacterium]|nr:hypothetical protein [Candidatus Nomurabacteria bacterium]
MYDKKPAWTVGGVPATFKSDGLDSMYQALLQYLCFAKDTSINKETFSVYKQNKYGVSILSGPTHNIFFVMVKKRGQIILLENKITNKVEGGRLVAVKNNTEWEIQSDSPAWKQKNGDKFYYWIGAKNGRFESPKDIAQTLYDFGPVQSEERD